MTPAPLLVAQLCELISSDRNTSAGTFGPTGMTGTPMVVVKVERATGKPDRIVVVRRVWEELTSPEF